VGKEPPVPSWLVRDGASGSSRPLVLTPAPEREAPAGISQVQGPYALSGDLGLRRHSRRHSAPAMGGKSVNDEDADEDISSSSTRRSTRTDNKRRSFLPESNRSCSMVGRPRLCLASFSSLGPNPYELEFDSNAPKAMVRHSRRDSGSVIAAGSSAIPTSRRSSFPNALMFIGQPRRGPSG
jgi:hypothetical protein